MFRSFDVWKRKDASQLVRYRCFEDLANGTFCVQSSDFYQQPIQLDRLIQSDRQFLELLVEESPFSRAGSFISIEQAIEAHESTFNE